MISPICILNLNLSGAACAKHSVRSLLSIVRDANLAEQLDGAFRAAIFKTSASALSRVFFLFAALLFGNEKVSTTKSLQQRLFGKVSSSNEPLRQQEPSYIAARKEPQKWWMLERIWSITFRSGRKFTVIWCLVWCLEPCLVNCLHWLTRLNDFEVLLAAGNPYDFRSYGSYSSRSYGAPTVLLRCASMVRTLISRISQRFNWPPFSPVN